jgi:hypothetical protein
MKGKEQMKLILKPTKRNFFAADYRFASRPVVRGNPKKELSRNACRKFRAKDNG